MSKRLGGRQIVRLPGQLLLIKFRGRPRKSYETFRYARAARMEPADRTRYIEGRLASISKRFFALHGLEKHVSRTVERLCLNPHELFYIASYFTRTVIFLRYSCTFGNFSLVFDGNLCLDS